RSTSRVPGSGRCSSRAGRSRRPGGAAPVPLRSMQPRVRMPIQLSSRSDDTRNLFQQVVQELVERSVELLAVLVVGAGFDLILDASDLEGLEQIAHTGKLEAIGRPQRLGRVSGNLLLNGFAVDL